MLIDIHNELVKAVLSLFYLRFTPGGRVLWVNEERGSVFAERDELHRLGVRLMRSHSLPTVVINDDQHARLALIDVSDFKGLMTEERREVLTSLFHGSTQDLVLVNAFTHRSQFQKLLSEFPWNTVIWFANDPDHLIHFNGERFLGPYGDALPTI